MQILVNSNHSVNVTSSLEEQVKAAGDLFEREFQHIRLEQMRARLAWAATESHS